MKKADISKLTDSEVFAVFHDVLIKSVKEANSVRGETKKTMKEYSWIVEECINRFNLDRETLERNHVLLWAEES